MLLGNPVIAHQDLPQAVSGRRIAAARLGWRSWGSVGSSHLYSTGVISSDSVMSSRPALPADALLVLLASPGTGQDWPQYRGPRRDGVADAALEADD